LTLFAVVDVSIEDIQAFEMACKRIQFDEETLGGD